LNLSGTKAKEWNQFIIILVANFIILEEDDPNTLCCSKNPKSGEYIVKFGYKVWEKSHFKGDKKWWWIQIWKFNASLK
jgi:hypothetical protein